MKNRLIRLQNELYAVLTSMRTQYLTSGVEYSVPDFSYRDWLLYGIERGYCTDVFCNTHDGYPMHPTEERAWDEGFDPCAFMVRLGNRDDWSYWETEDRI